MLAAGAWSGDIVARSFYDRLYRTLLAPRAGHLLELPYPDGMQRLSTGVMASGYTRHYTRSGSDSHAADSHAADSHAADSDAADHDAVVRSNASASAGAEVSVAIEDAPLAEASGEGQGKSESATCTGGAAESAHDRAGVTFTATTSHTGTLLLGVLSSAGCTVSSSRLGMRNEIVMA